MTTNREKLEEIEKRFHKHGVGGTASDIFYLITQLKASWDREARLVEGIKEVMRTEHSEFCDDPHPEYNIDGGEICNCHVAIAHTTLAAFEAAKKEVEK